MISRAELKDIARKSLANNWGIAIGAYLLYSIIISAITGVIFGVGAIFAGVFTFGLTGIYMSIIRTNSARIETLFSGVNYFGTTLLTGLLISIFTALWSLLFIIPGIVKSYSYAMSYYILNDNPTMSATAAIDESRRMMDGHKAELFVLDLSFIGWYILVSLTFGLLSLYVVPYHNATRAAFYENLKALPSSK